jgi:integrase
LQPNEIRALLASATTDRYRTLLATAIFTGCRLQELLALRWQDFDLEAGELDVRHQLSRKGRRLVELKSEAGVRTIALMPELVSVLREHWMASRCKAPADYVFATEAGGPLAHRNVERRAMDAAYERALEAKLMSNGRRRKPVLHDCRHTFGSMLIAAGENVYSVSRAMGHANVSTTLNVYAGEIDRARNAEEQRSRMSGRFGNLMETAPRNQPQDERGAVVEMPLKSG